MALQIELGKFKFAIGKTKPKMGERGATGTSIWSGIVTEEYLTELDSVQKKVTVFDKMRKGDGMVKAILLALNLSIKSAEWYVEGGEDVDKEVIEFTQDALFKRMSISWNEFMNHVLLMLPFGFSMFEKVFKVEDNRVYWKKLAPRLPQSLYKWILDKEGGLKGITQFAQKGEDRTYEYIDIPIKELLVFSFMREGSNFEGTSILRSAYKHWFIKDMLYKVAGIGLERQAVGFPLAILGDSFSQTDRDNLDDLVKKIRVNEEAGAVLPPGFDLKFLEGKVKSTELLEHIEHHDKRIAQCALANFLSLGEGKTGSFALSKDQSDFFMMNMSAVCTYITEIINRFAIPQLIDYNFNVKEYPQLAFTIGKIDKEKLVEGLVKLVEKKVIIPENEDEKWARNLLGLPELEEEVIKEREEKEEEPTTEPVPFEASDYRHTNRRIRERVKLAEGGFWRKPNKYEERVKLKEIDIRFSKAEKALIAELAAVSDVQITDLITQIERAVATGKLNELYKLTVRYRGDYAETLRRFMRDLAEFGKDTAISEVKTVGKVTSVEKISGKLKNWLAVKADTIVELHAAKMKARAMLTTLDSVNAGKSAKAVLFDVKGNLNDFVKAELSATANITVNQSMNLGRNEVLRSGDVKAAQFSAILDRTTCPLCRQMDERIIDVDNPDFERFTPPIHSSCRCIWVYIHKEEERVRTDWSTPSQKSVERHGQLVP